MDYLQLLEHSHSVERESSRLVYLSEHIFDFTTYDDAVSEMFARVALDICEAISDGTTFEYIKIPTNYHWYLAMCNMPFFADRIEWGTSIRGAWWVNSVTLDSCGLWVGEDQLIERLFFSEREWAKFISAVIQFGRKE
jgi:hypothetical protein